LKIFITVTILKSYTGVVTVNVGGSLAGLATASGSLSATGIGIGIGIGIAVAVGGIFLYKYLTKSKKI